MKFCPKCQTKYDEEIIRFCTRDGAPLVEENPSFTAMPSEASIDDIGEETIISRPRPVIPPSQPSAEPSDESGQRVVIPIGKEPKQAVRPLETPQTPRQPERKSNTALVVLLTFLGTSAVLAGAFGVWWFLSASGSNEANKNANANQQNANTNLNVNYNTSFPNVNFNTGFNSGTNLNANSNVNVNANVNANMKPSPTKTPTPKPSPTPDANLDINGNTVVNITPSNSNSSTNVRPSTPTPTASPRTSPSPSPTAPKNVNVGILNSRATDLRKPAYPSVARQMGASGPVVVQVLLDEAGHVVGAKALSGHPLLRSSAETAARQSAFSPVKVGDRTVRANGTIVYNFINQ